ncbi:hypothetical protein ACO2I3_12150 [Leptospira interrogans]
MADSGDRSGVVSTSILVLVLIAAVVGALSALVLGELLSIGSRLLAIISGLIAVLAASFARYKLVFVGAGRGTDESRIPTVLVVNAAIASIAGSLAAHDLAALSGLTSAGILGALAGLLSAILMALLMITYHWNRLSRR